MVQERFIAQIVAFIRATLYRGAVVGERCGKRADPFGQTYRRYQAGGPAYDATLRPPPGTRRRRSPRGTRVCCYDFPPDRDFIADYVPGSARVLVCAWAGHAGKFAALLGRS